MYDTDKALGIIVFKTEIKNDDVSLAIVLARVNISALKTGTISNTSLISFNSLLTSSIISTTKPKTVLGPNGTITLDPLSMIPSNSLGTTYEYGLLTCLADTSTITKAFILSPIFIITQNK